VKNNAIRSLIAVFIIFQSLRFATTFSGLPTDTTYDPATGSSYTSKESWQLGLSLWALSFAFGFIYFYFRERRRKKNLNSA